MRIIGGNNRGKKLYTPENETIRPTTDRTREAVFNSLVHNYLAKYLNTNNFLDIKLFDCFAGTGAFGLEAYSRGVKEVLFYEKNPANMRVLKRNIDLFNDHSNITIENKDATEIGSHHMGKYNLIFLDPPYYQGLVEPVLDRLHKFNWLEEKTLIIIEKENNEVINTPDFIEVLAEKKYGKASILYCLYKS